MLKCSPGLAEITFQGKLYSTETKKKFKDESYKNKKVTEFSEWKSLC